MDIAAYLSLILVLIYLLVRAADWIEDVFVVLAEKLGISTFIIGFVILGAASSLPEISIALTSSINQTASLSVGNLVGASLVVMTLIIAVNTFIHKKLSFSGKLGYPQVVGALGLLITGVLILVDQKLTTVEGLILIGGYGLFVAYLSVNSSHRNFKEQATIQVSKLWNLLIKGVVALVALLVLSNWIVQAAIQIGELLEVPNSAVGLLLLSLGTTIPEITILIRSRGRDKSSEKLAVGNFLGSACANMGVLGLLAVLNPIQLDNFNALLPALILLSGAAILFALFAWSDRKITRQEGILLLSVYVMFILAEGILAFTHVI